MYIGETKLEFHSRMTLHRFDIQRNNGTAIADHFNSEGHTQEDVMTYILEGLFPTNRKRKYRESYLIRKFNTLEPFGINRSIGTLSSLHCSN